MDIKFILTWFSCHYYQLFQNFNVMFFVVFKQVLNFWPFSNSQCTNEVIKRSWIHLSMCELTYNQSICNKTPYILNLKQSSTLLSALTLLSCFWIFQFCVSFASWLKPGLKKLLYFFFLSPFFYKLRGKKA